MDGGAVRPLKLSQPVRDVSAVQLWDLLWRDPKASCWLADDSWLTPVSESRLTLCDDAGPWLTGRVVTASSDRRLVCEVSAPNSPPGAARQELTISVEPKEDRDSRLVVEHGGFCDDAERREAELYWLAALQRLKDVLADARARRNSARQAVIVIHGIGEQQPGRTLRDFVASGVFRSEPADRSGSEDQWVKPDRASGLFELRRVTVKASTERVRPTTDVYELYWAHIIRDTTATQVATWVRRLLLRRGAPRAILPALWTVRALVLFVTAALVAQLFWDLPWLAVTSLGVVLLSLLWRLVGRPLALQTVGDAARYLSPNPENIAHRQSIRQAGVDLVETLHRRGDYDRIIMVGHSLGSVIAYDVITHAWIRMHTKHDAPRRTRFAAGASLEKAIGEVAEALPAQDLQHAAWLETRENTQPWLITDLVTLGSPLTYASFLTASSASEFEEAQRNRVLPTCPPQTEMLHGVRRCSFQRSYRVGSGSGASKTFTVFHHAAPFAVTRWTNLYFPARYGGLSGDLVGGPVAPQFGAWVNDVPLTPPVRGFAHTWYWRTKPGKRLQGSDPVAPLPEHIAALAAALRPDAGRELRLLARDMPVPAPGRGAAHDP